MRIDATDTKTSVRCTVQRLCGRERERFGARGQSCLKLTLLNPSATIGDLRGLLTKATECGRVLEAGPECMQASPFRTANHRARAAAWAATQLAGEPAMAQGTDREYLLNQQYRNAANLGARMQLHQRLSTNKYGWHRWVFDQLHLPPEARILELGCGPGSLWRENGERIPESWQITLSDFSRGMVQEAQQSLSGAHPGFTFEVVDAQAIPFAAASFDAVIANHMLYHVPDRAKAFSEIRRVLKPQGRFFAATNGPAHMRELHDRARAAQTGALADSWVEAFNLENGREELSLWFPRVSLHRYEDALVVTEAEPLVAYVLSGRYGQILAGESIAEFRRSVEAEIARHGSLRITKETGLFEAWQ